MKEFELQTEIEMIINSRREDDYWDFKEKHHSNKANLLHDIICMANNRADRNAYIIYGIADMSFKVVGLENDENRRTQQNIIDIIKGKKFAAGIRPRIELRSVIIENQEVDVLIINNSTDTPYFLLESFVDNKRTVRAHHIYTRVGDTNTDIDKSADLNIIEYLWKKRFLLTRSPFDQIIKRLENKSEWKQDGYTYYSILNPEYTISIDDSEDNLTPEFYSYAMTNEKTMFQFININYFGTKLYGTQAVVLDSGIYSTPVPEWGYLHFGKYKVHPTYALKYFIMDDPAYKLNEFFYDEENGEERDARRRFFEVVLLFEDLHEKEKFMNYVHLNENIFTAKLKGFDGEYSWIESNIQRKDEQIVSRLKVGKVLKQMLVEYRNNN